MSKTHVFVFLGGFAVGALAYYLYSTNSTVGDVKERFKSAILPKPTEG